MLQRLGHYVRVTILLENMKSIWKSGRLKERVEFDGIHQRLSIRNSF